MKKILLLSLSFLVTFCLWSLWATPALADGPCDPVDGGTYYLHSYVDDDYSNRADVNQAIGAPDGLTAWFQENYGPDWASYSLDRVISGTIQVSSTWTVDSSTYRIYLYGHSELGASVNDPGWFEISGWSYNAYAGSVVLGSLKFGNASWAGKQSQTWLDSSEITLWGCEYATETITSTCETVSDADFDEGDWLLANGAVIADGALSLPQGGIAAQNLSSLEDNTNYTAVISVSQVTTATELGVVLGTDNQTLSITGTGQYEASLATPNLGGPLAYGLQNGSGEIEIDFTCLYGDSGARQCIAPTNGEFEGSDGWDYYRGAVYNDLGQNAYLPFNPGGDDEKSLLVSSATYSMPTLDTGEYLLLAFESRTTGDSGVMGVRVNGTDTFTGFYEIYPNFYEFEANLSTLADQEIGMAFVNSGVDPISGFTGEDDLYLDNVCIWVSDRPAELPEPIDDNPIIPPTTDFGWNYTCADIPGILYSFGINVLALEAIYEAGVSVWDPSGWVPWLAAALWVNAGKTISCFILSLFGWLVSLIQYLLNEGLNWLHWARLSSLAFVAWLGSYINFLSGTAYNWLNWFATGLANLAEVPGYLFNNLAILAQWVEWLGNVLGGNELRTIANWFIDGWNFWLESWGVVLSGIIDLLVGLWNMATPLLESIWSYVSSTGLLGLIIDTLVDFIDAGWNLFWVLLSWLWENVFMAVNIPIQFYYAFDQGINSDSFSYILECDGGETFWCRFLAGVYLVNQTSSQSIVYPVVIVGIIVGSIIIFWRNIWSLFKVDIQ